MDLVRRQRRCALDESDGLMIVLVADAGGGIKVKNAMCNKLTRRADLLYVKPNTGCSSKRCLEVHNIHVIQIVCSHISSTGQWCLHHCSIDLNRNSSSHACPTFYPWIKPINHRWFISTPHNSTQVIPASHFFNRPYPYVPSSVKRSIQAYNFFS